MGVTIVKTLSIVTIVTYVKNIKYVTNYTAVYKKKLLMEVLNGREKKKNKGKVVCWINVLFLNSEYI